jgi:hypothetical protein
VTPVPSSRGSEGNTQIFFICRPYFSFLSIALRD